jgi:hypothetical protein
MTDSSKVIEIIAAAALIMAVAAQVLLALI